MTLHLHILKGCSPEPLAFYLKALGIMRLIVEQGRSRSTRLVAGRQLCLLSRLSRDELEKFSWRHMPHSSLQPLGAGQAIMKAHPKDCSKCIGCYRSINNGTACDLPRGHIDRSSRNSAWWRRKADSEQAKAAMMSNIRMQLRGTGIDWLNTVVADLGDTFRGPAILGTGGNEGSGSYTAAFLAAIVECVVRRAWDSSIASCFWNDGTHRDSWDGSFNIPVLYPTQKQKGSCQSAV